MTEDYISILQDSLEKKIDLLGKIIVRNEQQRQLFESEGTTPDELDNNIEAKGRLVDQILALDDGFEQLFARVRQELSSDRDKYRDEIASMQESIRKITELTAKVESQEQRNRTLATGFFSGKKGAARQMRKGAAAVSRYYQGMMRSNVINPQILDTKE